MNFSIIMRFSKLQILLKATKVKHYAPKYLSITHSEVSADSTHKRNNILQRIISKIQIGGPISVADYMKECLTGCDSGYYMKQDVFGRKGDFITSPEISQIFGELIGVWFVHEWMKLGKPSPLQLVELGPGRGTLCQDILRVFSSYSLLNATSLHLVEVSPYLQEKQKSQLEKYNIQTHWHDRIQDVPREKFTLYLAHEFFDALPIHKFERTPLGWREILIDVTDNLLHFVQSRNPSPVGTVFIDQNETRNHIEVCPSAGVIIEELSVRIVEDGGIALIADYGHEGEKSDTFRAFQNHSLCDPLKSSGSCDLTADVDFKFMKEIANKRALTVGPITQADFLNNMGIQLRLQQLVETCSADDKLTLESAVKMLTDSQQMGERYKFMAVFPRVMEQHLQKYPVAGF